MSARSPYKFIRAVKEASTRTFAAPGPDRFGTNCTQNCTHHGALATGTGRRARGTLFRPKRGAPFFAAAFARYHQLDPTVSVNYSAVGSSLGIKHFSAGAIDFGASDVPMTTTEQAEAQGGPVVPVPVEQGGTAPAEIGDGLQDRRVSPGAFDSGG